MVASASAGATSKQTPITKGASSSTCPSKDVIVMWEEVADKLIRSQKVASKTILESLENAHQYLNIDAPCSSPPEARHFVENHLAAIMENILEQKHDKIEKLAKYKVEKILRLALEIVKEELMIQKEEEVIAEDDGSDNGVGNHCSFPLFVLASIFDKKKLYYNNNDQQKMAVADDGGGGKKSSSGGGGHPQLRINQINHFHRIGGFTHLSSYILSRPADDLMGIEYFSTLHPLLEAMFEAIFVTREKEMDSANIISKAVMGHLGDLGGESLAQLPTRQIQLVRIDLHRINKRLTFSNRQKLSDFHKFWRSLTLNLISCSISVEHKLFGLKQIVALIDSTHVPKAYTISGAGTSFINGKYELASSTLLDNGCLAAQSVVSYERTIPDDDPEVEARGKMLKLHPCLMTEAGDSFLSVWWFLSETDDSEIGADYYCHKSNSQWQNRPPLIGWSSCGTLVGVEPTPMLEPQSELIPIGDERISLEKQLSNWMVENKVFDIVLGEQNNFMDAPTSIVKFLSEINSGNKLNRVADNSALNLVLGQTSKLLEPILPLLLKDPSPPAMQSSLAASSAIAPPSSSDFFTATGAAKQRLASAERWRRSTQNAVQEYLLASKEEQNARAYLAELEHSREVINVDGGDSGDDSVPGNKKQSKRRRKC